MADAVRNVLRKEMMLFVNVTMDLYWQMMVKLVT